jgi:hypothetical protein
MDKTFAASDQILKQKMSKYLKQILSLYCLIPVTAAHWVLSSGQPVQVGKTPEERKVS